MIVKKSYLFILFFIFCTMISCFGSENYVLAANTLDEIRVGLLYNDKKISSIKSVDEFEISSDNGIEIISYENEQPKSLIKYESDLKLSVRKDVYFVNNEEGLFSISPTKLDSYKTGIEGPFHIRIDGVYDEYSKADEELKKIEKKGANAFLAYNDHWEIWSGNFYDKKSEVKVVTDLKNKLGSIKYSFVEPSSNRIIFYLESGNGFFAYESKIGVLRLKAIPKDNDNVFKINHLKNKMYRGELEVLKIENSDLTIINVLKMSNYLYGVVPFEIGASAPKEALKAQAVAARNYGITSMGKHNSLKFDICNTTHCQYYGGYSGESIASNEAVDETNKKVLRYEDKIASIFYFSSSGGRTEDVENVWGSSIPYLKSVKDEYESGTTWHYNWEIAMSASKVKAIMNKRGYKLGDILGVNITKRSEAGRAVEIIVYGTNGEKIIERNKCRTAFGLDSQWYDIETELDVNVLNKENEIVKEALGAKWYITSRGVKQLSKDKKEIMILDNENKVNKLSLIPENYRFIGIGWGHSVGMSQDGAIGMAENDFTYEQILEHYFVGTKVEDL